jgi:hypothetical protein
MLAILLAWLVLSTLPSNATATMHSQQEGALAMLAATLPVPPQIRFLMYHLEIASRMADKSGVGKMTWLLDFEVSEQVLTQHSSPQQLQAALQDQWVT